MPQIGNGSRTQNWILMVRERGKESGRQLCHWETVTLNWSWKENASWEPTRLTGRTETTITNKLWINEEKHWAATRQGSVEDSYKNWGSRRQATLALRSSITARAGGQAGVGISQPISRCPHLPTFVIDSMNGFLAPWCVDRGDSDNSNEILKMLY